MCSKKNLFSFFSFGIFILNCKIYAIFIGNLTFVLVYKGYLTNQKNKKKRKTKKMVLFEKLEKKNH